MTEEFVPTPAEKRILKEVAEFGKRVYNGRLYLQILRLRSAGLVEADFDIRLSTNGSHSFRITVTALPDEGQTNR